MRSDIVGSALERLARTPPDLAGFTALWAGRDPESTAGTAEGWRGLGDRALRLGEPLLAYDVLSAGLKGRPRDVRLRQLLALALARSGAAGRANELLSQLRAEGCEDEETLGILARTHKDLAAGARTPAARRVHLRAAARTYLAAFAKNAGYYSGINAAATALLTGEAALARALARKVRGLCLARLEGGKAAGDGYWLEATLGEAALILGEGAEAEERYGRAAALARGRYADLSSTRRQAALLAARLGEDPRPFERLLRVPGVVAFTGHMADLPGRRVPRFPAKEEGRVRASLRGRLGTLDAGFGFSSAACGADILFIEEMLRRRAEVRVVLPFSAVEFRRTSVDVVPGWGPRFDRALRGAASVVVANEFAATPSAAAFAYGNLVLDGLARLRAGALDAPFRPLAVWDGRRGDGPGGTGDMVGHWRRRGEAVSVVALPAPPRLPARAAKARRGPAAQRVMAMLFADAVGYSKLSEEQIPRFSGEFLAAVARLTDSSAHKPVTRNTWGDAVYFVFRSVEQAGCFALTLRETVCAIRWRERGLPQDLNFRIALHAGPVFECRDPVTRRPTFVGTHVSRAARIEPVTPPGQVYASQSFAALAAASGARGFACDYVGVVPLAKRYGSFPLYHLRPA